MKRLILILLTICLLLGGCGGRESGDTANFYYRRIETDYLTGDGVICPEEHDVSTLRGDPDRLLKSYFSGPTNPELELPFPRDTEILSWELTDGALILTLSESFAGLSGIDLTVACGCITKTFLELTDADSVVIRAQGISDVTMTRDNLHLTDDSLDKLRTELTLYYTDESRRYLIGFNIAVNQASQSDMIRYLVSELLSAPTGLGLVSALPEGTRLIGSTVEDGTCTLHLSQEFESNAYPESFAQRTTLLSIANTLTQLDEVERVEIYIGDNLMAQYRQLNIIRALVFDESAIGPVRTGVNEFDATLYLSNGSEQYLAVVPVRLRQSAGSTQAELVLQHLIGYYNPNSFSSPLSPQTRVLGITTRDGLCTVDLSEEFLESDSLPLAVRSVAASLCALDEIDRVQITVEGKTPTGENGYLFEVLTVQEDWYI